MPSLVQTIMRVLDHDVSSMSTRELAEAIAAAVVGLEERVREAGVKAATLVLVRDHGCWMQHHCRDLGDCGCEELARSVLEAAGNAKVKHSSDF